MALDVTGQLLAEFCVQFLWGPGVTQRRRERRVLIAFTFFGITFTLTKGPGVLPGDGDDDRASREKWH